MNYLDRSVINFLYPISIIFIYLVVLVFIAESINRSISEDPELTRKIVHIGSGNVILIAWWLNISGKIIIIASAIASIIALVSYFTPILPSINSVGRNSLGTLFYAISIGILTALFWDTQPEYTAIGILVMAWGDGMAAIIGQRFGKHKYTVFNITKSWEGSLAMFVAAFLVISLTLLFCWGNSWSVWLLSIVAALVATILESFSTIGIDNFTVPLSSALVCYFYLRVESIIDLYF